MRVVGIIAEFDPFHNGHEYIIRKAKELTGDPRAKALIVMSGPFVQRGNFSVLPKHVRAHQALCNGADLVLELPFTFACAPSERFARGAVQALYKTGIVTDIAFGIDTEDPSLIEELAFTKPDDSKIREHLSEGYSYPSARASAVADAWKIAHPDHTEEELTKVLSAMRLPNSVLGADYLRAMKDLGTHFKVHMIRRTDEMSASDIREKLYDTLNDGPLSQAAIAKSLVGTMPDSSLALMLEGYGRKSYSIPDRNRFIKDIALAFRSKDTAGIAYMTDGLDGFINNVFEKENIKDYNETCGFLSTKHFTIPRILRAMTSFMLGQSGEYVSEEKNVRYLRVLGFSREGRYCLKIMRKCARLPILSNPSDALSLYSSNPALKAQFELDLMANDLQASYMGMPMGYEWDIAPVMVK